MTEIMPNTPDALSQPNVGKNALYRDKYGAWAGSPDGHQPDYLLCCQEVEDNSTFWPRYRQCRRKRGFGPDDAYCKQHDPDAVALRRRKADERAIVANRKWLLEANGEYFFKALEKIAAGHNDPRGLAKEIVERFGHP